MFYFLYPKDIIFSDKKYFSLIALSDDITKNTNLLQYEV